MTWSIVHFVVDDTVEVVPSQWIKRNGYCAWPKTLKINEVKKLVQNKVRPNKFDFNLFKARCMAGDIDNYLSAQKKCDIAKYKTDLSSTEEMIKKRKKFKNKKQVSSSESDCEESDDNMSKGSSIPRYLSDLESSPQTNSQRKNKNLVLDGGSSNLVKRRHGWSPLKPLINNDDLLLVEKSILSDITETPLQSVDNKSPQLFSAEKHREASLETNHNSYEVKRRLSLADPRNKTEAATRSTDAISKTEKSILSDITESPLQSVDNKSPQLFSAVKRRLFAADTHKKKEATTRSPGIISKYHNGDFDCSQLIMTQNRSLPKTLSDDSNTLKSKKIILDDNDAFKKSVLHQLLTIKFEIRSMDEKLNFILNVVENDKKVSHASEKNPDSTNFETDFPIKSFDELDDVENKISTNTTYRLHLVQYISSVGGLTVKIMVKRIMGLLFIPELLTKFSYNGRGNKKRCFYALLITKIIFESVLKIKKFSSSDNSKNEIEQVLKYILIQTPFKLKKQDTAKNKENPDNIQIIAEEN
ncbi:uncharacterized protein LOC132953528 [Metopolophium dirhodum]|uniref:uncharacterized protein LOC132953528 n=1 Tax=Metopolophium dirhodum TaxID=44670 RepID=UPI00298F9B12|nr:uncharacterized protein LOC132953528 [Metopolophium dirhodum]